MDGRERFDLPAFASHCSGRTVKGIKRLSALYPCDGRSIPAAFGLVQKPLQCDGVEAGRQEGRKAGRQEGRKTGRKSVSCALARHRPGQEIDATRGEINSTVCADTPLRARGVGFICSGFFCSTWQVFNRDLERFWLPKAAWNAAKAWQPSPRLALMPAMLIDYVRLKIPQFLSRLKADDFWIFSRGERLGMAAEVAQGSCTDLPPARK